jgi:FMN phosphatase YigB (HAD superfamily)
MRACDSLGVSPKAAMYVGDHPLHDIDPANAIGMATVLVKRGGRHATEAGRTKASHEVKEFGELGEILKAEYGVAV